MNVIRYMCKMSEWYLMWTPSAVCNVQQEFSFLSSNLHVLNLIPFYKIYVDGI
jgi:predicted small integral membrane protein